MTAKNIHEAILEIMGDVKFVQKERSKDMKYSLKTENAVIQAVRPAMLKRGVYMYPVEVKDVAHSDFEAGQYKNVWNRIVATHIYRFVHVASDTSVDVAVLGDGADMGDKAGNKSMTTSKKYALLEVFLLETGDDPDLVASEKQVKKAKTTAPELPKDNRAWSDRQKNALTEAKLAKNEFAARGMLGLSSLPVEATVNEIVVWGTEYRKHRATMLAGPAAQEADKIILGIS